MTTRTLYRICRNQAIELDYNGAWLSLHDGKAQTVSMAEAMTSLGTSERENAMSAWLQKVDTLTDHMRRAVQHGDTKMCKKYRRQLTQMSRDLSTYNRGEK